VGFLREKHWLRVLRNRVLGRKFGNKRDKVTGEWRRLHNEELQDLLVSKYYLGAQIKKNEMGVACSM
jgi:hypothetical protein